MKVVERQRLVRRHLRQYFGPEGSAQVRAWVEEGRIIPVIVRGEVKLRADNDLIPELQELIAVWTHTKDMKLARAR